MTKHRPPENEMLDPDVRFLLANERTLLAWVRTGLTLQAGGFALAHFSPNSASGGIAGIAAIISGGIMAVVGYTRFKSADHAIRNHQLPKTGKGPTIEVMTVVATAFLLAALEVISLIKK
jgi:putative membrane protein